MSSSKQWLQTPANGADNGGAELGATGFPAQEVVLEATVPGATEKQLERSIVAGSPNEGMGPNVDRIDDAEGEGQAFSVPPRAGEKRPWDEAGDMDHGLEATVLRWKMRHGFQGSSSSSSQRMMVSQETQTDLTGEMSQVSKKSQNKMKEDSSVSSMGGEGGDKQEKRGVDSFEAAPTAEYAMDEEEILEMEAERIRQLSEEADEMRQVSEEDGFRKDERLI